MSSDGSRSGSPGGAARESSRAARDSLYGAAVVALVLLAGGGLLLLGNLGFLGESFTTSGFLRKYWPIILIGVGLWRFAADGGRLTWKSCPLLAVGAAMLCYNLGWIRLNPRFMLPLALLALGGLVLFTIRRAYRKG